MAQMICEVSTCALSLADCAIDHTYRGVREMLAIRLLTVSKEARPLFIWMGALNRSSLLSTSRSTPSPQRNDQNNQSAYIERNIQILPISNSCVIEIEMRRTSSLFRAIALAFCLIQSAQNLPKANASIFDWVKGENVQDIKTLSIVEISEMRVRDIKRRLVREHGYGSDEIAKMIDKKELINALSYEEHKAFQKETERKKRVAWRRSIIVALICVIFVMFRPLFVHAWEVIGVNVEVYTGKFKVVMLQLYDA